MQRFSHYPPIETPSKFADSACVSGTFPEACGEDHGAEQNRETVNEAVNRSYHTRRHAAGLGNLHQHLHKQAHRQAGVEHMYGRRQLLRNNQINCVRESKTVRMTAELTIHVAPSNSDK
ncbi:MAG: hypothetical protein U0103_13825 [Candidatus Obscuribacterales bacterium]